jgi:hypothetical protein
LGNVKQDTRARILDSNTVLEQVRLNMRHEYSKATRARIQGLVTSRLNDDLDETNPYLAVMSQRSFIEVVMSPLQVFAP